jgi:hypothetical protein
MPSVNACQQRDKLLIGLEYEHKCWSGNELGKNTADAPAAEYDMACNGSPG